MICCKNPISCCRGKWIPTAAAAGGWTFWILQWLMGEIERIPTVTVGWWVFSSYITGEFWAFGLNFDPLWGFSVRNAYWIFSWLLKFGFDKNVGLIKKLHKFPFKSHIPEQTHDPRCSCYFANTVDNLESVIKLGKPSNEMAIVGTPTHPKKQGENFFFCEVEAMRRGFTMGIVSPRLPPHQYPPNSKTKSDCLDWDCLGGTNSINLQIILIII